MTKKNKFILSIDQSTSATKVMLFDTSANLVHRISLAHHQCYPCRTMLFNINTLKWDDELIRLFDLHPSMFPEVKYSDQIFGYTEPMVVFDEPVAIAGLLGDSHAALFGQNCFKPGMTRNTKKAHIVRAALESIAYQIKDLIDLMLEKTSIPLVEMRVDGGPIRNNFLMQFQSDMLRQEVFLSNIEEISALGAAFMAGLACGLWEDLDEIKALRKTDNPFQPVMPASEVGKLYAGWKLAVKRVRLTEY